MKTTRRRWLTALTGLIALPLLPRATQSASAALVPSPAPTPSLKQLFATQTYPTPRSIERPVHFQHWEASPRQPLTLDAIQSREESLRCALHDLRLTRSDPALAARLEAALDQCQFARRILRLQPTGRPIVFNYLAGTTPNRQRTVRPMLLFQPCDPASTRPASPGWNHLDPLYLQAYCLNRLAPRTFRLDHIQNAIPLTPT
jgi:hypothetical protein